MARALGLAVTAWSPLARGVLVGKESPRRPRTGGRRPGRGRGGRRAGHHPSRVALAWLLHHGVMPVLGVSRLEQLEDNLGAAELELDEPSLERLDAVTAVALGYPHEFLRVHGGPPESPLNTGSRRSARPPHPSPVSWRDT